MAKRSADDVKSWYELWFELAAFKFRRLSSWTPEVIFKHTLMVEWVDQLFSKL